MVKAVCRAHIVDLSGQPTSLSQLTAKGSIERYFVQNLFVALGQLSTRGTEVPGVLAQVLIPADPQFSNCEPNSSDIRYILEDVEAFFMMATQ